MSDKPYLSAQEAAGELGVSVRTLYAYVSRGLVRSEETGGSRRTRRYRAEDVRALKGRRERRQDPEKATESALDWGSPVTESEITLIEDGRLYYRGRDAVELSERCTLEKVAELIWTGNMLEAGAGEGIPELLAASEGVFTQGVMQTIRDDGLRRGPPTSVLGAVLQRAAPEDPAAYDLRSASVRRTGARILWLLTATAAEREPEPGRTIASVLQEAWLPGKANAEGMAALINQALVLCADHELNVSAFTARCVASAGATPYAAVIAGLSALSGVRHGDVSRRVEALLREIEASDSVYAAISDRLGRGEDIPGFGHQLYPGGDPRARVLLEATASALPGSEAIALGEEVQDSAYGLIGERANVDFALAVLSRTLGLPVFGGLMLFSIGRTVGWVGHAIEQYEAGRLIRPRARYVGSQPTDA